MKRLFSSLVVCAAAAFAQVGVTMVGHEYRQDDLASIASAPDGSLWVSWLSWDGTKDDIGLRHYKDGEWSNIQWVPATSGDNWMPQIGVDASNRVWLVWTQMLDGNWDVYARSFDPASQSWGPLEKLSGDPLPDINPRLGTDGKGKLAVVWQGFRGKNSNIFLRTLEGGKWGPEVRVTNRAANDWEPAVGLDSAGAAWVAYDTYKAGNYDVAMVKVAGGTPGPEIEVAASQRFEARPTVAVDSANRIWVAWEAGNAGWGKDQGYILRKDPKGVQLGGVRSPRLRVYDNGQWRDTAPVMSAFPRTLNTYQPHVFSDNAGSVWVVAKTRMNARATPGVRGNRGWWEYRVTHLDGSKWSDSVTLPNSAGRSSTRMGAVTTPDGSLWMAWDGDGRSAKFWHRPVRQQIHAGRMAPPTASNVTWGQQVLDSVAPMNGHSDEAADLKAIRGYTVKLGNKNHNIVRGDFHRHTELSWDGGGAADGSLQDFYRYMIDSASMDFGASTDHQGGAWPYWWWYTQKMTDMHHVPGTYAAIFGYERSATFPNGHRNMFFAKRSNARVTPFHMRAGVPAFALGQSPMGDEPGIGSGDLVANDTKMLYEDVRRLGGLAISHTSGTRMGTDWRDNDPDLEPVVEIFQGARTNYEKLGAPHVVIKGSDDEHMNTAGYQPEGMLNNAWAKGYKLGIITSSDHGSTHISYAMVYTDDFSRDGVLNGIRKRHTYGATDNIVLDVRMGNYFMGEEFRSAKSLPIKIYVRGTRQIAKVEVIKDSEIVYTKEPKTQEARFEFAETAVNGQRHYYYVRVLQDDGMIAWSSPFFVNYGK